MANASESVGTGINIFITAGEIRSLMNAHLFLSRNRFPLPPLSGGIPCGSSVGVRGGGSGGDPLSLGYTLQVRGWRPEMNVQSRVDAPYFPALSAKSLPWALCREA